MSTETIPGSDYRNTNLPVDLSENSTARFVSALFSLDDLSKAMAKSRADEEVDTKIIREAIEYTPSFFREISAMLTETKAALSEREILLSDAQESSAVEEAIEKELGKKRSGQSITERGISLAREVSHAIHPDKGDPVSSQTFGREERTDILEKASGAVDKGDPNIGEMVFVETMPQYYFDKINSLLSQGLSFQQIVDHDPELLPKIQALIYLAHNKIKQMHKGFSGDIERRAVEIKQQHESQARIVGFGIIYQFLGKLTTYCEKEEDEIAEELKSLISSMEKAGSYVGGADQYIADNGSSAMHRASYERSRVEDAIKKLAISFQELVQGVLTSPRSEQDIQRLISLYRNVVQSVRYRGEDLCIELARTKPPIPMSSSAPENINAIIYRGEKLNNINEKYYK